MGRVRFRSNDRVKANFLDRNVVIGSTKYSMLIQELVLLVKFMVTDFRHAQHKLFFAVIYKCYASFSRVMKNGTMQGTLWLEIEKKNLEQ